MATLNDTDLFSLANFNTEINEGIIAKAFEILDRRFAIGESLTTVDQVGSYFKAKLVNNDAEVFAAMFLDSQLRVISYEELFRGTIDSCEIYPREVARRALINNAYSVILGHCHPSGATAPSKADIVTTKEIKKALSLLDIRLLDHFVIGKGAPVSMTMLNMV